jgi:hypothetical protein
MPNELIELGGGRSWWFDDNQGNFGSLCCGYCCWSVTLGLVGSAAIVSLTPAKGLYITAKPGMGSPIPSPTISKYRIVKF